MNTWLSALVAFIVSFVGACAAPVQAPATETIQLLETTRQKYKFPGLACAVINHGRLNGIFASGMRKQGDPTPLTTNDIFHIGSCTKSMTSTLAATFIEQGSLRWQSTIGEVFPELNSQMDKQYLSVTLEQLLTHHGGVPGKPPDTAWAHAWERRGTPTQQRYEFISAALRQPPEAPQGTKYIYSNQGYAIAGAMLERVAATPYEQLMTNRLFKPLHMDSAGFGPPGTIGKVDEPWGHSARGPTLIPLQEDNPPAIAPAGTVHCSLADLSKFVICHLKGEQTGGLLKPETFRKLHTPIDGGGDYACGWICFKRSWAGGTALNHNGSNTMWYVVMWLAPLKDFAVIVATNTAGDDAFRGCDEVAAGLIRQGQEKSE